MLLDKILPPFSTIAWAKLMAHGAMNEMWHQGVVVITSKQHHLTKSELRFCLSSNPGCNMSEVIRLKVLLEIRLNVFCWSTIQPKIIIIWRYHPLHHHGNTSTNSILECDILKDHVPSICWSQHTLLKLVSAIICFIICFILIFSPNDSPSKIMKNVFYFIQKALFVLKIFSLL